MGGNLFGPIARLNVCEIGQQNRCVCVCVRLISSHLISPTHRHTQPPQLGYDVCVYVYVYVYVCTGVLPPPPVRTLYVGVGEKKTRLWMGESVDLLFFGGGGEGRKEGCMWIGGRVIYSPI